LVKKSSTEPERNEQILVSFTCTLSVVYRLAAAVQNSCLLQIAIEYFGLKARTAVFCLP